MILMHREPAVGASWRERHAEGSLGAAELNSEVGSDGFSPLQEKGIDHLIRKIDPYLVKRVPTFGSQCRWYRGSKAFRPIVMIG